jgi:hypothetical protein
LLVLRRLNVVEMLKIQDNNFLWMFVKELIEVVEWP